MAYEAVLVGTGVIYVAPVGTAFPVVNAAPAGTWRNMGVTDGGVTVAHDEKIDEHRVDTESGAVKATRSEEGLLITANLAEVTLENLATALGVAAPSSAAGPPATKTIKLYRGMTVNEFAVLFRGTSPYGAFNQQFEVPRCVLTGNISQAFVKDSKVVMAVEFRALVDPTAATDGEKFGRVVAQTA